ncbi:MAG: retroviral-like aspartic protease family protein [Spirochaetales bacterium]|jgi:clan AA aspartic protease|nr:retroviral-like aspartic protease family protein [Spirochaetales bacterium]
MGTVREKITLRNVIDVGVAKRGFMAEDKIRVAAVTALVDTGSAMLVINEDMRNQLGLDIKKKYIATLADGSLQECGITESVEIEWENRSTEGPALVLPDADEILLGAIPLEGMDVMVDVKSRRLVGIHGDTQIMTIK